MSHSELVGPPLEASVSSLALLALDRPEVARASESARYALSIVVTDEVSRQMAAEQLLILAAGRKAIDEAEKPLKLLVTRIKVAIADRFNAVGDPITEAVAYLTTQVTASLQAERSASEAARDSEAARVRAAEEAARQAVASGKPAPPPPVQRYIPPVDTQVKSGMGSAHLTHTLCFELEDVDMCPTHILKLAEGAARAHLHNCIKAGALVVPRDGTAVTHEGIRVWYQAGLSKKVG